MQTLSTIRTLLAERGLRPKHRFGQNFLHDQNQLRKLIDAADVRPDELVLEVGPGTGTLTEALVERGAEVVACELDEEMADIVAERLGNRVTLVRGDCLDGKHALAKPLLDALGARPFVLVANLPYGAATPLIAMLLTDHPRCRGQFVTIQSEVAERLMAGPGSRTAGRRGGKIGGKAYGPLSIVAHLHATIELVATLPPSCFWPAPEVTSAMIAIRRRERVEVDGVPIEDPRALSAFCAKLFAARRKQLTATLGRDFPFPQGIDAKARVETLEPEQIVRLWRAARGTK